MGNGIQLEIILVWESGSSMLFFKVHDISRHRSLVVKIQSIEHDFSPIERILRTIKQMLLTQGKYFLIASLKIHCDDFCFPQV